MEGPQFSSLAESLAYKAAGYDVIGMTAMPEAKLAREAELSYAIVAMVTDFDCWHPTTPRSTSPRSSPSSRPTPTRPARLARAAAARLSRPSTSLARGSDRALDTALITAPSARDPALLARLSTDPRSG